MVSYFQRKLTDHKVKGFALAAAGAIFGGAFYIPYKRALDLVTPEQFVLGFCTISVILNGFLLAAKPTMIRLNTPTIVGALAFALLSNIGNYCAGMGMTLLTPASVSVLSRTQIIMVMLLGVLIFSEKISSKMWLAAIAALCGVGIMANSKSALGFASWQGILWGLGSALSFGLTHVIAKSIIQSINPVSYNLFRVTFATLIMALIPGNVAGLAAQFNEAWFLIFLSALFGPTLSRVCQTYAIRYIQVSNVVFMTFLTPVSAGILGLLFLREVPSAGELLGGSIILISLTLASLKPQSKLQKAEANV